MPRLGSRLCVRPPGTRNAGQARLGESEVKSALRGFTLWKLAGLWIASILADIAKLPKLYMKTGFRVGSTRNRHKARNHWYRHFPAETEPRSKTMIRWMDARDLGLFIMLFGIIGWTLAGCGTPRAVAAYQDCLSCGVKTP